MVDHPSIRTGIDVVGSDYLTAQVEKQDAGFKVLALSKIARGDLTRSLLSDNGSIVLSVPDDAVIMKNIIFPQEYSDNKAKIIRFELEQMLLDEPDNICCDVIETDDSTRALAVVARKNKLETLSGLISYSENGNIQPEGFVASSIALGRGFIQFCSNDSKSLVCLADFAKKRVALCFVLENSIVATASFDRNQFELDLECAWSKIAAELKTIINFKLNELADRGINTGLARLVISGSLLNEIEKQSIAAKLGVQLEEPIFDGLLSDQPVIDSNLPISSFLVSLGLTVE